MQKRIFNKAPGFLILPVILGSTTLFAGSIGLTEKSGWDVGIQALYLKPSYTGVFSYLDDTLVNPTRSRKNPLKTYWAWGFKLEGSYHFCPNSDFNLNWYHWKKTSTGTFFFETNPIPDHYTLTPEWDAVNLEYGQSIHFDRIKDLRIHGGLQYAQLDTTYHGRGVDPVTGVGFENDFMRFRGIGPRMGADLSVGLMDNGLAAYFAGDVAMLVGQTDFHFNETFEPFARSGTRPTTVVPELGLKIGAKYDYAIPCAGKLVFDLGYMVVNYFDVLHLQDDFNFSETNFGLNGLYVGIKWLSS